MKPVRIVKSFLTVGFWTLASRLLGFVRDILLAAYLGAGPAAEAFVVAFSLPNMFRRFFAEGAFNTAFVPMFSKKHEAGEDPKRFAEDAMAGLATILITLVVIAQFAMPFLVLAMASGFAGDARFDLAVDYGRIAFPYIFFISLAALLSGVLNSTGRFAAAAAAPVLLNIALAGSMFGAHKLGMDVGRALVWAVPIAGLAQAALVYVAAARAGYRLRPRLPRITPDMKRLAWIAGPAMLAGGVVQINLLVGRQVASFSDGSIQYLNLADRLYQLPLGVVAIAIGVVLLPDLSRRLRANDHAGGRDAYNRAFEFALLLTLPAAAALIAIPGPLVSTLFEHGRFGAEDARATALAVMIYGFGLPAFVIQKVLQPVYFARGDTRTPFRFALVSMVVNAVLAFGLMAWLGYLAAAVGTSIASWGMVYQLWRGSRSLGDAARADERLLKRGKRIIVATLIMAAPLWLAGQALAPVFEAGGVARIGALALLVVGAIILYFGVGHLIGALKIGDLKRATKRS